MVFNVNIFSRSLAFIVDNFVFLKVGVRFNIIFMQNSAVLHEIVQSYKKILISF